MELLRNNNTNHEKEQYLILYGSETGTAEEVAFKLQRTFAQCSLDCSISSLDDYEISKLPTETCIIWVVATSGEGEVPPNMKTFWKFLLRKNLPSDCLKGVSTAVFGLGDSSYEKFNAAARRLNKRLAQLGSSELIPIGLGDDQSKYGYCTELDLWVAKLLTSIKSRRKYQDMIALEESAGASIAIAHYLVTVLPSITAADEIKLEDQIFKQSDYRAHDLKVLQSRFVPPESHKPNRSQMISGAGEFLPIVGYVRENKRITRDGWSQDVRHVVISFNSAFIQTPAGISDVDEEIELFHSATTDNMTDTGIAALPSEMPSFNNTISPYVSPICESPVSTAQLSHTAGDVATIYPLNHALLVTRMIAILNRSTHNPGIYTENDTKYTTSTLISLRCLPGFVKRRSRITEFECCSLGRLFSSFMDVAGMPQRGFFEGLALYTENTDEKEKLLEIASAEGTDLYYDYCVKEKRNYIEVLEDFKTAKPSLSQILELIPVLQPRHYSIANSGMVENNEIHLCVAVVSTKTPYGRERTGVCSGYISSLALNDQVLLYIRSGSLRLPSPPSYSINTNSADTSNDPNIENSERNDLKIVTAMKNVDSPSNVSLPKMILIGPGTGIAPMRALIRERKYVFQRMKQMNSASDIESNNTSFNHTLLFFGCRNRDNDFLYGEEWTTLKTSSRITGNNSVVDNYGTQDPDAFVGSSESVIVAFSRDQKDKVYVTDKIKQHGQLVWSHINEEAYIFISGSAKRMPSDVKVALKSVIVDHGRKTEEQAAALLLLMEKKGRYVVEAWS